jgi:hypothetical protein
MVKEMKRKERKYQDARGTADKKTLPYLPQSENH